MFPAQCVVYSIVIITRCECSAFACGDMRLIDINDTVSDTQQNRNAEDEQKTTKRMKWQTRNMDGLITSSWNGQYLWIVVFFVQKKNAVVLDKFMMQLVICNDLAVFRVIQFESINMELIHFNGSISYVRVDVFLCHPSFFFTNNRFVQMFLPQFNFSNVQMFITYRWIEGFGIIYVVLCQI